MDINLAHRPRGATHAGKEETHGSWYKKSEAGHWMFIDMGEDGLPDRQWCVVPDDEPGYELVELPPEDATKVPSDTPKDDGGPAFPAPEAGVARFGEGNADAFIGMTLRDYFATKCDLSPYAPVDVFYRTYGRNPDASELAAIIAAIRYIEADAMLAARCA